MNKLMKKIVLIMSAALLLTLASCGTDGDAFRSDSVKTDIKVDAKVDPVNVDVKVDPVKVDVNVDPVKVKVRVN